MKTNLYRHLLYTWLLAHLLHPFMFFIDCKLLQSNQLFFYWEPSSIVAFSGFGLLASVPAAFIAMFSLLVLTRSDMSPRIAFITWLIVVPLSAAAAGVSVMKFIVGFFEPSIIGVFVPGMMAGAMAVLIRFKQFLGLFRQINDKSISSYGRFYYGR